MALRLQFTFTEGATLEGIVFDATLKEGHSHSADITEFPVERGSNISDNVRAKPIGLTIEGFVSDYPLVSNVVQQFAGGAFTQRPSEDLRRSQQVFDKLIRLKDNGILIIVTTGVRVYQNMVISSVNINRDKSTATGLMLDITMRDIRLVDTETVQLKVAEKKAEPKKTEGHKTKKETSATDDQSLLLKTGLKALNFLKGP